MTKLIVLPGNSPKNKLWGESMALHYKSFFDDTFVLNYDHWSQEEPTINFETESLKLKRIVEDDADVQYVVFAKSFGSILALLSIHKGYIQPQKCVFFGMPLNIIEDQNVFSGDWSFLESFSIPSIAFHNKADPVADYNFLIKKLSDLSVDSIEVIQMPDDTHGYESPTVYEDYMYRFLKI